MTLAVDQLSQLPTYARKLRADPFRHVTVPGLLPHARALEVSAELSDRAPFDDACGLVPADPRALAETKGRHVTLSEFRSAPAEERYYWMGSTRSWSYRPGQRRLDGSCPLTMAELADLLYFFRDVSGSPLTMIRVMGRQYADGNFIGPHSEDRLGRILSGHLFLTPGWSAADSGGYLEIQVGTGQPLRIHPDFNTLTVFDVRTVTRKSITRVTAPTPLHELQFWCYAQSSSWATAEGTAGPCSG